MSTLSIDPSAAHGPVKPLNAVNNGPVVAADDTQTRGNLKAYQALRIPFARTHDAAFFSGYGGEHTVDISAVFPRFEADPENPANYDFTLTDLYMEHIRRGGAEPFYRLGQKIEHAIKKYGTLPPVDFKKWAVVCEHLIRHLNYGWAGGHRFGIRYWEIWNEPDMNGDDDPPVAKKCWGGTKAQFFDFFRTALLHLKGCFPELKIGGPALCWSVDWGRDLLTFLATGGPGGSRVPLDFLSWHHYTKDPATFVWMARKYREILDETGYTGAESILNEWNYVRGWTDDWVYSIEAMNGMKGAAFCAATIAALSEEPLDMLMYYDARPTAMNGLFNLYTYRPQKPWWAYYAFAKLLDRGTAVHAESDDPELYVCAARSDDGRLAVLASRFVEPDDVTAPKRVTLRLASGAWNGATVRLLDETHDLAEVVGLPACGPEITVAMAPNTVLLVET